MLESDEKGVLHDSDTSYQSKENKPRKSHGPDARDSFQQKYAEFMILMFTPRIKAKLSGEPHLKTSK